MDRRDAYHQAHNLFLPVSLAVMLMYEMFTDKALALPNRNVYSAGASPAQSGDESRTSRRYVLLLIMFS